MPISPAIIAATRLALTGEPSRLQPPTEPQAHPAPFAAAWSMGPPDIEPDVRASYAGGTCFALAPLLQQRITRQLGIKSYVVGTYGGMNILTKWPGLAVEDFEENQEALGRLGHITHADVVVPVRVFEEAPMRLMHIQCGPQIPTAPAKAADARPDSAKLPKLDLQMMLDQLDRDMGDCPYYEIHNFDSWQ